MVTFDDPARNFREASGETCCDLVTMFLSECRPAADVTDQERVHVSVCAGARFRLSFTARSPPTDCDPPSGGTLTQGVSTCTVLGAKHSKG